ncbi:MAG: hypothetical protein A2V93_12500 [Ignavibacteria bacterium RBG_16_34_14]|nr:MAG: hypothetical protein A2V93_12500 [Ignavibacteria bacterium RBG_16_34_14]
MKALITFLFLAAIAVGLYYFLNKEENFDLTDHIIVTQPSGMDENAPSVSTPPSYISIEGTITNISDMDFSGIVITYKSGLDTLKVNAGNLKKGESYNFKSNTVLVRDKNPGYKLIDITYNK